MPSDLHTAAFFISEGFCPECGNKLKSTKGHSWSSTKAEVVAHGECFTCFLCWVLLGDNRLKMTTHEDLNRGNLKLPLDLGCVAGGTRL